MEKQKMEIILRKAETKKRRLLTLAKAFRRDIEQLICVTKEHMGGGRVLSPLKIGLIIGALIYFINPFDLIPDFLPGGFVDDAAAVGYVIYQLSDILDRGNKDGRQSKCEDNQ